jgi:hypothetical protein
VYGAITYYLAHMDDVETYLSRREALWDEAEAEQERNLPSALKRLRESVAARPQQREGAR